MPKDTLVIDLEARSKVDIKHGIYRYVSDPSFKILINAAKLNDQPTQVYVNNQEENLPPWVVQRLLDPLTLKVAHNANFERVALSKVLQHDLPVEDWCCTAAEGSATAAHHQEAPRTSVAGLGQRAGPAAAHVL